MADILSVFGKREHSTVLMSLLCHDWGARSLLQRNILIFRSEELHTPSAYDCALKAVQSQGKPVRWIIIEVGRRNFKWRSCSFMHTSCQWKHWHHYFLQSVLHVCMIDACKILILTPIIHAIFQMSLNCSWLKQVWWSAYLRSSRRLWTVTKRMILQSLKQLLILWFYYCLEVSVGCHYVLQSNSRYL